MKKVRWFVILIVSLVLFASCSVSFPQPKPKDGIWYCEELRISIDFSIAQETDLCAKLHKNDGTVETIHCCFDFGSGIYIFEETTDGENIDYLHANFRWCGDEFVVTTKHGMKTYIFREISESD